MQAPDASGALFYEISYWMGFALVWPYFLILQAPLAKLNWNQATHNFRA